MNFKIYQVTILLIIASLFIAGCTRPKLYRYEQPTKPIRLEDELSTFKTQADLEAKYRFYPGRLKLNLTLLSDSKNRLRLRIHQPGYPQLLADIVKSSEQVFVLLPQLNQLFLGTETDLQKSNSIFSGIDLDMLTEVITPQHTFSSQQEFLKTNKKNMRRKQIIFSKSDENSTYKWFVNSEDFHIKKVIICSSKGKKLLKANYPNSNTIETKSVPEEIEIKFYSTGIKLKLLLNETILNPPLKEAVFQMRPQTNPDIYPLEQLELN